MGWFSKKKKATNEKVKTQNLVSKKNVVAPAAQPAFERLVNYYSNYNDYRIALQRGKMTGEVALTSINFEEQRFSEHSLMAERAVLSHLLFVGENNSATQSNCVERLLPLTTMKSSDDIIDFVFTMIQSLDQKELLMALQRNFLGTNQEFEETVFSESVLQNRNQFHEFCNENPEILLILN